MKEPDSLNHDDKPRTWSNGCLISINTIFLLFIPAILIVVTSINSRGSLAWLIAVILLWLLYELTVFSYVRVRYFNGILEFERPFRKYSLAFRRGTRQLVIHPDEWTEMHWCKVKSNISFYFRNKNEAAYFVMMDGFIRLPKDFSQLFPGRTKNTLDFPWKLRRKLKKACPERVM